MRFIGLDVHLDFCEIAICEAGRVRSGGRVPTSPQGLAILANSLGPDDHVALEATGNALAIARALEPHVARVVVATRTELRAITEAKVKTDRRDARTLARLLAAGLLHGCWLPDEPTRALRRRLARRAQLVRQRTRCQERGPRGADAHAQGPSADERRVRAAAAACGWPSSSCPPTSARPSTGACARSTSSTARSRSSNAASPSTRSAPRRSSA